MKICTKCKNELDETCFAFKNKTNNILHSQCKECQVPKQHTHYLQNISKYKTKARTNNKRYIKRNKEYVNQYKENKGCCLCKENTPEALDFHHITTDKENNISRLTSSSISLTTLQSEMAKCVVLCANCHRKVHAGKLAI